MSNHVLIDKGALQMALNVLDRSGKNEVADGLRNACREYAAHRAAQAEWPSEEAVARVQSVLQERKCYAYSSDVRAALQSVRPPATNLSEVSSKVVDAESGRPPIGVVSDEDVSVACDKAMAERAECAHEGLAPRARLNREIRAALESYASRHAPTKD